MKKCLLKLSAAALAICAMCSPIHLDAATITWVGGSGDWDTATNWSTGNLPGTNDDVVIGPGPAITVTHSLGTDAVLSIQSEQALVLSGGSLAVSSTFLADDGLTLSGGTLFDTTIVVTNGAALVVSSGTFDGVTVDGVLDVGNTDAGANLTVTNGLTLNGTVLVGAPNGSGYGAISFAGSQSLSGDGTVVFGARYCGYWGCDNSALYLVDGGTTLTIGPGVTVEGQQGDIGYSGSWGGPQNVSVVNQGTISASVTGGRINIIAQPFTNLGLVESLAGALNLEGTLSDLGSIQSGSGPLELSGVLANAGQMILLNGTNNLLTLTGGTIMDETIVATNGAALVVSSGTFDGVTVNGVLDVGNTYAGANLTVTNGLTLNGTALVGNPNGSGNGAISFAGSQSLSGNGTVVFGAPYCGYWGCDNNALYLVEGGTTLTIGPGITVEGQQGDIGYSGSWGGPQNVSVVNQGTISANVTGGRINIIAQPFTNMGLVESPAGTLNLEGTLSGLGNIQSGSGPLELSGVLANAGQMILLNGTTNLLTLTGGTIMDGTIVASNGAALVVSGGTFDGVTVDGVLDVGNTDAGANLTVTNGLTLNGTALVGNPNGSGTGAISFAGSQSLSGNGTVVFGARYCGYWGCDNSALYLVDGGTTLTIGPGITVEGQQGDIGYSGSWGGPQNVSVVNQGTISANVTGGRINIIAQPFTNMGLVESPAGTLNLEGTLSGLGNIQSGSGPLELSGVLANAGQMILLNGTTNLLTLTGGTIMDGTIVASNGAALVVSGGTFDGVTVDGVLDVGNTDAGANLTVTNGLTLNGTALVGNPNGSGNGAISFAGSQSLSGNGTVVFGAPYCGYWGCDNNALYLVEGGTTLTIGPGITVEGQQGDIGYSGSWGGPQNVSVVNQGTISANVTGGRINIIAQPFTNMGLVESPAGTLNLEGTLSGLGNIQSGSGPLELSGVLANAGQMILLNGTNNLLTLTGGTIMDETIVATNGAALVVSSGTFDGVTVDGVLDVGNTDAGANLTVTNGLTLNGTVLVGAPNGSGYGAISFAGSQSLSGDGTVVFGARYCGYWGCDNSALYLVDGGTTLTIGPGVTVEGQQGDIGYSGSWGGPQNVSVVNQGTISASVTGGRINIIAQPFTNLGLVESLAGALNLEGTLSDLGSIQSGSGPLELSGVLANAGQMILLNGTNNLLTLTGGTIMDETIVATNGAALVVSSGTFDGVTVNGVLDVGNTYAGANLTVTNGLTLNGTALVGNPNGSGNGAISFAGSQSLSGNGTVVFGAPYCGYWGCDNNALYLVEGGTTLTIGPGITVEGQQGDIGYSGSWGGPQNVSVVNQGTISANVAGGTITINAQPFSNQGTLAMQGGTINLAGSADLSGGTLNFGINGPGSSGQINISGSILLDGTFSASLGNGFQPSSGEAFSVLINSSSTVAFSCLSLDLGGGFLLQPQFTDSGLTLTTVTYATNASLPELFISDSDNAITLQWPLGFPKWVLQTTTNLAMPVWTPVSVSCGNEAVVSNAVAQQFYRLSLPGIP